MNRRTEILAALTDIDYLASPALGALQVLDNHNVDRDKLIRTLELDPVLTTNILKFANSAYYGCRREIHSVTEAVVRLGMKAIHRMLCMSLASNLSQRPVKGYDLPEKALWNHLVSTAVCMEILAREIDVDAPEFAFTAALLHDIGKLAMGTYLEVDAQPILELSRREHIPFDQAETRILGINHAEVGAELLTHWNLPAAIADAVRWHHDPEAHAGEKLAVDLIHVADAISMMAGTGLGIDGLGYAVCPESEKRLGITIHTVEHVICELRDETAKLEPAP